MPSSVMALIHFSMYILLFVILALQAKIVYTLIKDDYIKIQLNISIYYRFYIEYELILYFRVFEMMKYAYYTCRPRIKALLRQGSGRLRSAQAVRGFDGAPFFHPGE